MPLLHEPSKFRHSHFHISLSPFDYSDTNMSCGTSKSNKISVIKVKYDISKNTFFPSAKIEWNKLNCNIQKLKNIEAFLKKIV